MEATVTIRAMWQLGAILMFAVLSGCVVTVDPVISEDDATMDSRLLGSWEEVSGSDRAVVSRTAENTYAIDYTSRKNVSRFEARLGKLGEHSVLDVWPVPGKSDKNRPDAGLLVAGHLLLALDIGPDQVSVTSLDPDSMLASLRTGDVRLAHTESENQLVLHGTTADLRRALSAQFARSGALGDADIWRRAEERTLPVSAPCFEPSAWREADQLFRHDRHWIGADGAYSIDLGNDRTLWLFGDTWIDPSGQRARKNARMISNSLAIQTGTDPSNATIEYFWGTTADNHAEAFFTRRDKQWFWPGHGVRVDDRLILFLNRLRSTNTGLGFETDGWNAVMITNPDDEPSNWRVKSLRTPSNQLGIIVGFASVLQWGEYIYAFGSQKSVKSHPIFVARWPVKMVRQGDLMAPEWWAGSDVGWVADSSLTPRWPIFENGQSELTIHVEESTQRFLAVQTQGFGQADITIRTAPTLTGPWSAPRMLYRPPEYYRPNIMIYSAKSHPQLTGSDLVLTYATNSFDFSEHITNPLSYYPRFVRLTRCE
jgi:hypothetical protein